MVERHDVGTNVIQKTVRNNFKSSAMAKLYVALEEPREAVSIMNLIIKLCATHPSDWSELGYRYPWLLFDEEIWLGSKMGVKNLDISWFGHIIPILCSQYFYFEPSVEFSVSGISLLSQG
jgi:hypothetical protein